RRQTFRHHATKLSSKLRKKTPSAQASTRSVETYGHEWAQKSHDSKLTRLYEKGVMPYLKGKHLISDLAQLDYALMREMLASIRQRARASGLAEVPVILENHTKDIQDFAHIERFVS